MAALREKLCYCMYGCQDADPELGTESDFDAKGYCRHLVGFFNCAPGRKARVGMMFEKLGAIYISERGPDGKPAFDEQIVEEQVKVIKTIKDEKTGEEVHVEDYEPRRTVKRTPRLHHSGQMHCTCKDRDAIRASDTVVTPEELQRQLTTTVIKDGVEHKRIPRLGLVARVYRRDGNTPVVTKPKDDDPRDDIQARIDDKMAELADLKAKHAQVDSVESLKRPVVDEEAQAAEQLKIEKRRMREPVTA